MLNSNPFISLVFASVLWLTSCNQNPICNANQYEIDGQCECYDGYKGDQCQELDSCLVAKVDCGSHGVCNNGDCECEEDFMGTSCELAKLNLLMGSFRVVEHNFYEGYKPGCSIYPTKLVHLAKSRTSYVYHLPSLEYPNAFQLDFASGEWVEKQLNGIFEVTDISTDTLHFSVYSDNYTHSYNSDFGVYDVHLTCMIFGNGDSLLCDGVSFIMSDIRGGPKFTRCSTPTKITAIRVGS